MATVSIAKPRKCILVIEDHEEAMRLVQHALQEYGDGGYRLEWAKDLQSGVARIAKGGIDIVLLDLGLPDSAGASSYSWVHQIAPELPVLVLTGDTREETEFAVLARGADNYLVKSHMSGALLMRAIQTALDLSKRNQMRQLALRTATLICERIQTPTKDADPEIVQDVAGFLPDGF